MGTMLGGAIAGVIASQHAQKACGGAQNWQCIIGGAIPVILIILITTMILKIYKEREKSLTNKQKAN